MGVLKQVIQGLLNRVGYKIVRSSEVVLQTRDMDEEFFPVYERCKPFTQTSIERMFFLYKTMAYITAHEVPGDVVECGVWKGGSAMMVALALMKAGDTSRRLVLYDTYAGMPDPGVEDVSVCGEEGMRGCHPSLNDGVAQFNYSPLDEVRAHLESTGYPLENIDFVEGKVEDTIPGTAPESVAALRLDTDWYESTRHELVHLYPRLARGGVLILDDYGYWQGARKATDEFFDAHPSPILLTRIDDSCRVGVKLDD